MEGAVEVNVPTEKGNQPMAEVQGACNAKGEGRRGAVISGGTDPRTGMGLGKIAKGGFSSTAYLHPRETVVHNALGQGQIKDGHRLNDHFGEEDAQLHHVRKGSAQAVPHFDAGTATIIITGRVPHRLQLPGSFTLISRRHG